MLQSKRARQLPHLSAYLGHASAALRKSEVNAVGCVASVGLSGALLFLLFELMGPFRAVPIMVFLGLPAITYLVFRSIRWFDRPKTREEQRSEDAGKLILHLHAQMTRGKLRRSLDPTVASLLEECARHWERVRKELSGAFWTSEALPTHWIGVRERAIAASERAMRDVLLLLEPYMAPPPKPGGLGGVIEDIVETVFEPSLPPAGGPLPPVFEPARKIAEGLKLLAAEVEAAGKEVAAHEAVAGEYSSAQALEACLGELRTIRQAEAELQRHLGQE